jgi:hypothetical protein
VAEQDAELNDPKNIRDLYLSAAWNYADSFCDAAKHGFSDLDGIEWQVAAQLLEEVAQHLRDNQPIVDDRVLGYSWI